MSRGTHLTIKILGMAKVNSYNYPKTSNVINPTDIYSAIRNINNEYKNTNKENVVKPFGYVLFLHLVS